MATKSYEIMRDEGTRLANQLMIGHGAALLVIFNATGQHATPDLRLVAIAFAIGLISAFAARFNLMMHDTGEAALAGPEKVDPGNVKILFALQDQALYAFVVSAATFVIGLVVGIWLLG